MSKTQRDKMICHSVNGLLHLWYTWTNFLKKSRVTYSFSECIAEIQPGQENGDKWSTSVSGIFITAMRGSLSCKVVTRIVIISLWITRELCDWNDVFFLYTTVKFSRTRTKLARSRD